MKTKLTLILFIIGFTSMSQIPQSSNLVGEYKFNSNASDSSGNAYDGQTFGGPTLIQDRFGNSNSAYSLDGADDYIHFDDNMLSEWNVNASGWIEESFTISFWAKSSKSAEEPIISFGVHNSGGLYGSNSYYKGMITRFGTTIKMNSNNWPTYSNNAGFPTSDKTYDGNWHHYVLVWNYDTGYRQAYIDGFLAGEYQQVESNIIMKRFNIRDKALSIGRERYGNDGSADDPGLGSQGTYTGSVDEVRIWNLALSSSEISNLYSYDNTSSNYFVETFTNSSGDGQWDTPSNWASGSVPSSSTNVTISSGQSIEAGSDNAGTVIASAGENQTLSITAPSGLTFTSVDFASYGNATSDGANFVIGPCHAANSESIVEGYLLENTGTIFIPASNDVFGDPCVGTVKRLYVKATYGSSSASNAVANNLTIDSGGSLTVAANSDLTLSGDFTNNGTVTLNSDSDEFSSIIVGGSSTGDIVYNRYVNTVGSGEWDLIGSPVDGLSISGFVTTNSSVLAANGSAYAVGYHDNTDDSWTNYTTSTVGGAGNFDIARGYQMATSSGATMAFTGSIATTDQTQSIINNNGNGNGGRRWNLVANPFPSYLNANTNAHASNNFLSVNASVIDSNFLSIYGWDADGSGYTIYNNTSSATYIAPGQAFFVAAASSSAANLSFTEAMQTTTGGDDFINLDPGNTSSEFSLKFHQGDNLLADTKFYFDYGLNPGLDPGYDAGAYNQTMALSSRLAEEDQGINMGINAMNVDSFEQTAIALVVNTEAGTTFRISMEDSTIPENVDVLLLDTQTQISTNLRDQDFTLTPQSDLSGMGRFYLKMGSNSLGGNDIEESLISIYKPSDRDYIVMEGLSKVQSGEVTLYNIMGQEVLDQILTPNQSTQNIPTTGLDSGIYIIKLKADNLILTKKLIIK
jgi:hypothetical protein